MVFYKKKDQLSQKKSGGGGKPSDSLTNFDKAQHLGVAMQFYKKVGTAENITIAFTILLFFS